MMNRDRSGSPACVTQSGREIRHCAKRQNVSAQCREMQRNFNCSMWIGSSRHECIHISTKERKRIKKKENQYNNNKINNFKE